MTTITSSKGFSKTAEQSNYISVAQKKSNILNALFGAGKTITMVDAIDEMLKTDPTKKVLVTVFTNQLKAEIETKLNAKGISTWGSLFAKAVQLVGEEKATNYVTDKLKSGEWVKNVDISTFDSLAVGLYKNAHPKTSKWFYDYHLPIGCYKILYKRYRAILEADPKWFASVLTEKNLKVITMAEYEELGKRVRAKNKILLEDVISKTVEGKPVRSTSEETEIVVRFVKEVMTILDYHKEKNIKTVTVLEEPIFDGFTKTSWEFAIKYQKIQAKSWPRVFVKGDFFDDLMFEFGLKTTITQYEANEIKSLMDAQIHDAIDKMDDDPDRDDKSIEDEISELSEIMSEDDDENGETYIDPEKKLFYAIYYSIKTFLKEAILIVEHHQNDCKKEVEMSDLEKFDGFMKTSWDFAAHLYKIDPVKEYGLDFKLMSPSMNEFSYFAFRKNWFFTQKYGAKWNFKLYDEIFVDECQDMSPLNLNIILRYMKKPTMMAAYQSRVHFIGDPKNQEINQWKNGVWDNVYPIIKKHFPDIEEMSLTISHRIPQNICRMVSSMDVDVKTSNKKEGSFISLKKEEFFQKYNSGLVLSSKNEECLEMVEEAIKNGLRFNLKNNDFKSWGQRQVEFLDGDYKSHLKKVKGEIAFLMDTLYDMGNTRVMIEQNKEYINLKMYMRLCVSLEKYNQKAVETIENFNGFISQMFNGDSLLTISTIHSAKGLEADVVGVYGYDNLKELSVESKEKMDLYKVAITRTKDVFVNILKEDDKNKKK